MFEVLDFALLEEKVNNPVNLLAVTNTAES